MSDNKSNTNPFPKYNYFEIFSHVEKEKKQEFTTLVFTIFALSLFGLFAISPTLSTIANLQKQVSDNELVLTNMNQKIMDIGILKSKYDELTPSLPIIFNAMPQTPESPAFAGKLQQIAKSSNVTVKGLQVGQFDVVALPTTEATTPQTTDVTTQTTGATPLTFSVDITGSHDNVVGFLNTLTNFDRITSVDSFTVSSNTADTTGQSEELVLSGKAYYMQ